MDKIIFVYWAWSVFLHAYLFKLAILKITPSVHAFEYFMMEFIFWPNIFLRHSENVLCVESFKGNPYYQNTFIPQSQNNLNFYHSESILGFRINLGERRNLISFCHFCLLLKWVDNIFWGIWGSRENWIDLAIKFIYQLV